jgi:hypothetical protein
MDIFSPIQTFADFVTYNLFNIAKESYAGHATNFFIYDIIKIGILLILINYIMAITRYYFPMDKVKNILILGKGNNINFFSFFLDKRTNALFMAEN